MGSICCLRGLLFVLFDFFVAVLCLCIVDYYRLQYLSEKTLSFKMKVIFIIVLKRNKVLSTYLKSSARHALEFKEKHRCLSYLVLCDQFFNWPNERVVSSEATRQLIKLLALCFKQLHCHSYPFSQNLFQITQRNLLFKKHRRWSSHKLQQYIFHA